MKRSEALILIANQLDFLAGIFEGYRTNFTEEELKKADVILTTLEEAGMQPPEIKERVEIPTNIPLVISVVFHYVHKWEEE